MNIFDWEDFRKRLEAKEPTRDAVIARAFEQYVNGNDSFEDKSSAEMSDYFATFRSAWILSEMMQSPQQCVHDREAEDRRRDDPGYF